MAEWNFEPNKTNMHGNIEIPFFEDARADFAPYYRSRSGDVADAQSEVTAEMGKLGAGVYSFLPGIYTAPDGRKRHGYEIQFYFGGAQGIIRVACLPFSGEATQAKLTQARIQALKNVRDWLKSAVTAQVFSPGASMLIPFMLVDGTHTVSDYIHSTGNLPRLNPPVIENGKD